MLKVLEVVPVAPPVVEVVLDPAVLVVLELLPLLELLPVLELLQVEALDRNLDLNLDRSLDLDVDPAPSFQE